MVDWFHWSLKAAMHASCSGSDWVDQLPWVPLGLRAGPREEDALSPTQAVFGNLCTPKERKECNILL